MRQVISIITGTLLMLLMLGAFGPARAEHQGPAAGDWNVSLYGGWAVLDDGRGDVPDDVLLGVGVGYYLSSDFSLDFEVERVFTETNDLPPGVDNDFELNSASLIARYYFRDAHHTWRPYLLFGLGLTDHSGVISESSNLSVNFGGGVRAHWSERYSGRFQIAYRRDTDIIADRNASDFNDFILSAGVSYHFGRD